MFKKRQNNFLKQWSTVVFLRNIFQTKFTSAFVWQFWCGSEYLGQHVGLIINAFSAKFMLMKEHVIQ